MLGEPLSSRLGVNPRPVEPSGAINDEIPAQLYTAVAEVLAYVFQLKSYREFGGRAPAPLPEIAVPAGLDPNEVMQ